MLSSGKLLILAMVAIGLAAAAASWWFRYSATHRAAQFWGPDAARLIRDADEILLCRVQPDDEDADAVSDVLSPPDNTARRVVDRRDVSAARGITHLRNALLEDRSFRWPATRATSRIDWRWCLAFRGMSADLAVYVWFTPELDFATHSLSASGAPPVVSCEPIARGLAEFFAEQFPADGEPPTPSNQDAASIR